MDAAKDYYRVLGVTVDADAAAVQAAYRALAKKYHPDAPAETRSAERFIEVQEAYEVLGARDSKGAYDEARAAARAEQERQAHERAKEEAVWRAHIRDEPEIADHHADLSRLARSLGRRYRSGILAGMDDRSPGDFARFLEEQFITRHFGEDPQMRRLGKALLEDGQRSAAAELASELRKLPDGRLTPQHRKDFVARFKPKHQESATPNAWPRLAPFVGLAVILGLIAIGLVDFMRSGPKDVSSSQIVLPTFGGPQIGQGLKPTVHKPALAAEQDKKPINDRVPGDGFAMPETTATITRDEPLPPALTSPSKWIYDRIQPSD
jgi:curved DNA-binding protein CbpA